MFFLNGINICLSSLDFFPDLVSLVLLFLFLQQCLCLSSLFFGLCQSLALLLDSIAVLGDDLFSASPQRFFISFESLGFSSCLPELFLVKTS